MANVKTEVTFLSFQLKPEQTICQVHFKSDAGPHDAGAPWDGGKRFKTFPIERDVVDIIQNEIATMLYMNWERID